MMLIHSSIRSRLRRSCFVLASAMVGPMALAAEAPGCGGEAGFEFVCGLSNAEDLVHIPGTRWIVASRMTPGGTPVLIDAEARTWREAPMDAVEVVDRETYPGCSEPPVPETYVSHGLSLRSGRDGTWLYVVGHGGREAIEVYAVDTETDVPRLTWSGCVPTPEAMAANSVATTRDGSLLATIPLEHGRTIPEAIAGQSTGAVYAWSPGDPAMQKVEGTEQPYANGIEVSADGQRFYVVTSGTARFIEYANTRPARELRSVGPLEIVPDNLRRAPDGRMLTAGLVARDVVCGDVAGQEDFDLAEFAACPRPFIVYAIDPETMEGEDVVRGPRIDDFSNITIGIDADGEIWIGTFGGDRVAVAPRAR